MNRTYSLAMRAAVLLVAGVLFVGSGIVLFGWQLGEVAGTAYIIGGLWMLLTILGVNEITFRLTGREAFDIGRIFNEVNNGAE